MDIAVQGFGLKKEFEADFRGTFQALRDLGVAGIEPMLLLSEKQGKMETNSWAFDTLRRACDAAKEFGLSFPSAHVGVGYKWAHMPAKRIIQGILQIHEISGIRTFVISGLFDSPMLARSWARLATKVSDGVKPYGCRILYHNHSYEFRPLRRGGNAMDVFLAKVSPDVLLQVDIGWVGASNDHEEEIVRRYGDRIASFHLKDFYPQYREVSPGKWPDEAFAPIGEGVIHTKEILELLPFFPYFCPPLIIDQDKSGRSMLEDLRIALSHVRAMLEKQEGNRCL